MAAWVPCLHGIDTEPGLSVDFASSSYLAASLANDAAPAFAAVSLR
jgi:hypothetical protein